MKRTCVIVAFGDVTGFSRWIQRGSNSLEVTETFIDAFYAEIESFVRNHTELQIKYLGDGFMILKELRPECNKGTCVTKFVKDVSELTKRLAGIVKRCDFPRPEGFRSCVTHGHVSKREVLDPVDPTRKRKVWEFIGYAINLAQKLLQVAPDSNLLVHESTARVLLRHKSGIRLKSFQAKKVPVGVDPEDLHVLFTIADGQYRTAKA